MLIKKINLLLIIFVFISNVNVYASKQFSVSALFETPQVKINGNADDPAIWFNETNPGLSIVFGTDKYNGIYSYNLKGEIIGFSESGSINNIDLRTYKDSTYIVGTDTSANKIYLWKYKNSYLHKKSKEGSFSIDETPHYSDEVNFLAYGVCAGLIDDQFISFVTEAKGPE